MELDSPDKGSEGSAIKFINAEGTQRVCKEGVNVNAEDGENAARVVLTRVAKDVVRSSKESESSAGSIPGLLQIQNSPAPSLYLELYR